MPHLFQTVSPVYDYPYAVRIEFGFVLVVSLERGLCFAENGCLGSLKLKWLFGALSRNKRCLKFLLPPLYFCASAFEIGQGFRMGGIIEEIKP
jgi:hypothetical protein